MTADIRRRPRRAVWLPISLVVLAAFAVGTTNAGAARDTSDHQLLKTYQPVLVFHPDELFQPTKVKSFVKDSELEQFTGTSQTQLPLDPFWTVVDSDVKLRELPPVTPGAAYRLDQVGCEADAPLAGRDCYAAAWERGAGGDAVYGRVVRTSSQILLQYWLFYYDNPLVLPPIPGLGTFWQSHEGDWEVVNVVLGPDEAPLEAAYSQHCSGQRKAWAGVEKWPAGSTHPVAYVALGSHANYFAPGVGALGAIPINPTCIPAFVPVTLRPFVVDQALDGSATGAVVGPPAAGRGVVHASITKIEDEWWASFGGRWGESEYFFTPVPISVPPFPPVPANTAVPLGLAPASPANQANWDPATVLGWPLS